MLSLRALADRLVADGVVENISHQRVSQLAREDPAFPPVVKIGRSNAVDYRLARPYFAGRIKRPGWRTDVHGKPPASE